MIPFSFSFWQGARAPVATDPTLEIWYDFADNSTITLGTGTDINSVDDKSTGSVKPANSTGGKRPKQSTSFQNGKNVSYFDGTNDLFTINPITNFDPVVFPSISGCSMLIVGRFNSVAATNTMTQLGTTNNQTGQRNEFWLSIRGGDYQIGMGQGLAKTSGVTITAAFHLYTAVFDGTKTGNANRLRFRVDGVDRTLTFSQDVQSALTSNTSVFYIGETANGLEDLDGYVGELLLYTRAITATEILNTENYLKQKWGLA